MKKRVIFLLTGLFIWTSVLLAQNVPEGVIGASRKETLRSSTSIWVTRSI